MDSPPSAKKSKKKNSVKSLDSNQTPPKIFDDTDWGELDNANIKTTPNPENNFQAVFFKKKSKSTSKKLAKNNEKPGSTCLKIHFLDYSEYMKIQFQVSEFVTI